MADYREFVLMIHHWKGHVARYPDSIDQQHFQSSLLVATWFICDRQDLNFSKGWQSLGPPANTRQSPCDVDHSIFEEHSGKGHLDCCPLHRSFSLKNQL